MEVNKLKRRSRQGAIISAFGFIMILASFLVGSNRLIYLNDSIEIADDKLDSLENLISNEESVLAELTLQNLSITKTNNDLERELQNKNDQLDNYKSVENNLLIKIADLNRSISNNEKIVQALGNKIFKNNLELEAQRDSINQLNNRVSIKLDSIKVLGFRLNTVKDSLKRVLSDQEAYKSYFGNNTSTNIKLKPKASADRIENSNYFHFSVWLETSEKTAKKIEEVTYYYNHPTFPKPYITISNSDEQFRTSYRGWGCLDYMPITITYKDSKKETIIFRMCEELGDFQSPRK